MDTQSPSHNAKSLTIGIPLLVVVVPLWIAIALLAVRLFIANAHSVNGDAALAFGEYETAAWSYQNALRWFPHDYEAHYSLGLALNALGNRPVAEEALRDCIRLAPNHPLAFVRLASLYTFQRDMDKAQEALERADDLVPTSWRNSYIRGHMAGLQGEHREATRWFREALDRTVPPEPDVLTQLAVANNALGEHDEAIEYARRAIRSEPDNPSHRLLEGKLLLAADRLQEAIQPLEDAIQLGTDDGRAGEWPSLFETYALLGRTQVRLGDLVAASRVLSSMVAMDAGSPAVVQVAEGIAAKLASQGMDAFDSREAYGETAFRVANAYFAAGKLDDAVSLFEQAIAALVGPERTRAAINLARLHLRRNEAAKALKALDSVEARTDNLEYRVLRADALARAGNADLARASYLAILHTHELTARQRESIQIKLNALD